MAIQSSFPKLADQILTFNRNIIEVLSKLNTISTTTDPTLTIQLFDDNGTLNSYQVPSINSIKQDIERLNNNINSLYSIDASGAMIQTTTTNKFKKIITVDLNREPVQVQSLNEVTSFKSSPNWFFDSLMDPMVSVEFDLSGKIEDNVRKCFCRRYIVEFATDNEGNFTNLGLSALNSFNSIYNGNSQISIDEFENWHKTTPGILEPLNPKFDEQIFDLNPNNLLYDGEFSVLRIQEDRLNRKLYYVLDTLDYMVIKSGDVRQLTNGDELFVNSEKTSTKYKIIEISTAEANPRIRVERIEGLEPIPVGIGTLKIYSPVVYEKKLNVSVGYDERNVVFLKPINTENNLMARKWSLGVGYYTSDLRLNGSSEANGLTMENFYTDYIYDYGQVLKDLVAKKTPNKLAGTPNSPTLNLDNFKVVQINQHLTDSPDSNSIKQKHNIQLNLKSEIEQLQNAQSDKLKKLKFTKLNSIADKKKSEIEIKDISDKTILKRKLLSTVTQEIIDLSKNPKTKVEPKFRVRGFWSIPEAVSTRGTKPQEVVQFRVQYRYISKDGKEPPVETYKVDGQQSKAVFSNWNELKTDARKRGFDPKTGEYFWQIEDLESADTPNINQIDISIQINEKVEMRVKSISEVGWPESPVESDWSEIITIEFPDDLNNVLNENDFILQEATKEELKVNMTAELSARGLDTHLEDQVVVDAKTYHHESNKILSGFKDSNGNALDLFEYLKALEDRVKSLEEKIQRAKGELEVVVFRNNQEFVVENGSETVFNVECEDYLEKFTGAGIPGGRVYENNIYVIKDFVLKIKNKATGSPLGLLSDKNYLQNSQVYNKTVPQCFWINDKDELITSDISGSSKTQINNQFIWQVNYDSVNEDSVTKLSENIGNAFTKTTSGSSLNAFSATAKNTVTGILSNSVFNLGYNETTVLNFVGNNKSLLEQSKWVDSSVSVASTNKLLTTIHPVVQDLEKIVETNTQKVRSINPGDKNDIIIPINIYFKMNALDSNQTGLNYQYVNLNKETKSIKHTKKIRFILENESENRPFVFSIKFNINRNKIILKKVSPAINLQIK
jgi:hypothetical protein